MRRFAVLALLLFVSPLAAHPKALSRNPLVGTWELQQYVDVPEGEPPVYAFGNPPVGLFVFTAEGHVSISLMRNPPAVGTVSSDPDPDACIPSWYCSYFGTYQYNPAGPSWTTHVAGGNIPHYLDTDQRRTFKIKGDLLTILETYSADGKTFHTKRVLRRISR